MLVRSWNVFHGNTQPPQRRGFLEEMVRLASKDGPDVLCLQELPVWSLRRLGRWSGMTAVGDVARRALLAAPPARAITSINHGFFRSAFTGEANAILLGSGLEIVDHRVVELSRKEHRICQAVVVRDGLVLANLHASGDRLGVGATELERALGLIDALGGAVAILAGDFNVRPQLEGFSPPGPGIDHVLVRGAAASPLEVWPLERRTVDGHVLSDHAPVELRVDL